MAGRRKKGRKTEGPASTRGAADGARFRGGPQQARFDLGHHARVLEPALGPPPPGYGLTLVRGWIRAPGRVVAAWDVNDPAVLGRIEQAGWQRFVLRALGGAEQTLAREVLARRGGTHHLQLAEECRTVRLVIGLEHEDGFFQTLARSGWIRMPPPATARRPGATERASLAAELDRRALLRGEPPARMGHLGPEQRHSPGARLADRLRLSLAAGGSSFERESLSRSACGESPASDQRPAGAGARAASPAGGDGGRRRETAGRSAREEPGGGARGASRSAARPDPSSWGPTSPPRPFGGGPSGEGP